MRGDQSARKKRVSSHPEVLVKRAEDAHAKKEDLDLEPEEVDALMEGITRKIKVVAEKSQQAFVESAEKLNGLSWRPPAPGPTEKLG